MAAPAKETTYKLLVPVTFEGREHAEIKLRRVKARDIRDLEREDAGSAQTFFLISRLSDWPPEGVEEMDAADIEGVATIIEGFIGKKRPRR
ncbi:phage tail assembly protein [Rhodomicrobium sp.]|uniref:phage tail assembly protein n=1 Tax=Rhodomicrobium sp. TaxID=2720632 RepID=UPI0039E254CE